jgi:dTDP-glucose 4,6-dehydratase
MRLLVTGGCGFIGSSFVNYVFDRLDSLGCELIVNLDAMYYCASIQNVRADARAATDRYVFVKGNLCSADLVQHVLETHRIDTIVHFAAQSHVQNSFTDSLQYTQDNIVGTHTLLECARLYGKIARFVHISTDEVYGESVLGADSEKKTEHGSILCPTNPYAATKAAAELMAHSYYKSFDMPIIITRGNNVYGPNQYPEKVIPLFIDLLLAGKPVTIQGDGSNVRAFLHVDDVCAALLLVLKKGRIGEIYNIGSDDSHEFSILEIARKLVLGIHGPDARLDDWVEFIEDRPFNDTRYYISNDKVKQLGWTQVVDFDQGVDDLIRHRRELRVRKIT